jgi:hypothetical protein
VFKIERIPPVSSRQLTSLRCKEQAYSVKPSGRFSSLSSGYRLLMVSMRSSNTTWETNRACGRSNISDVE